MVREVITGGAGLIGREAAKVAKERGHDVAVIDMKKPEGLEDILFVKADITSEESVKDAFTKICSKWGKVDVVQHYAALFSYEKPYHALKAVNVTGTKNVVKAAIGFGAQRIIYMGAVAEYEEGNTEAISEDTPFAPCENYGKTKQEGGIEMFKRLGEIDMLEFKAGMVYGPGQVGSYLDAMFNMVKDAKGPILAPWENTEDHYLHIHDIGRAATTAAEYKGSFSENAKRRNDIIFNLGDEDAMGVHDTLRLLMELIPSRYWRFLLRIPKPVIDFAAPFIEFAESFKKDRTSLPVGVARHTGFNHKLLTNKFKDLTGFKYFYESINKGFPEVVEWYYKSGTWTRP